MLRRTARAKRRLVKIQVIAGGQKQIESRFGSPQRSHRFFLEYWRRATLIGKVEGIQVGFGLPVGLWRETNSCRRPRTRRGYLDSVSIVHRHRGATIHSDASPLASGYAYAEVIQIPKLLSDLLGFRFDQQNAPRREPQSDRGGQFPLD
jgi:hypothetical protein